MTKDRRVFWWSSAAATTVLLLAVLHAWMERREIRRVASELDTRLRRIEARLGIQEQRERDDRTGINDTYEREKEEADQR